MSEKKLILFDEDEKPHKSVSIHDLTREQIMTLDHTLNRAAKRMFNGSGSDIDKLVELGLMEFVGKPDWTPEPYYTLTTYGGNWVVKHQTFINLLQTFKGDFEQIERYEKFLKKWLQGTTCDRSNRKSIHWQSECGKYIVCKHQGHSEYTTMSSTAYCGTYFCLYDSTEEAPHWSDIGAKEKALWKHEGRWSKKCLKEIEEVIEGLQNEAE